jgi:hypothetical protein
VVSVPPPSWFSWIPAIPGLHSLQALPQLQHLSLLRFPQPGHQPDRSLGDRFGRFVGARHILGGPKKRPGHIRKISLADSFVSRAHGVIKRRHDRRITRKPSTLAKFLDKIV